MMSGKVNPTELECVCTYGNKTLQGDEGSLEIGSYADTCNDLVDDDLCPSRVHAKIDKETRTKGHHEHAEPDDGSVLSGLPDYDSCHNGKDGQCNRSWQQVDT